MSEQRCQDCKHWHFWLTLTRSEPRAECRKLGKRRAISRKTGYREIRPLRKDCWEGRDERD
jgi:hypothetical protein